MGTIEKGFMGGFKGLLGPAVGSKWKGKTVIKSRPPKKRTGPTSDAQLQQQAKFSLIVAFLKPLRPLLDLTYKKAAASDMSGLNKAFSANKDAITGVFPAFTIDFAKAVLSSGTILNADVASAASTAAGKVVFTWTDNSDGVGALSSDLAYVAVYNEQLKRWVQNSKIAARSAGTCTIDTPAFSGKTVQTYIGFMSADQKKISPSLFTGAVNVL
jgi:Family of unknown function (DUF6266)